VNLYGRSDNESNGTCEDLEAIPGSNQAGERACFPIILAGPSLTGSIGTTENFVRIGHSLFALLAGWLGGQLSRRLCRCSRAQEP